MEVKANVDTVLLGRILAGVIIAITFVYGIYAATEFKPEVVAPSNWSSTGSGLFYLLSHFRWQWDF